MPTQRTPPPRGDESSPGGPAAAKKAGAKPKPKPMPGSRDQAGPVISSDSPNAMGSTVGNASNKGAK